MSYPNSGLMPEGPEEGGNLIYIFSEGFNSIQAGIQHEAEGRGLRIGFVLILRQAIAYPSSISCLVACVALLQNFSHHA